MNKSSLLRSLWELPNATESSVRFRYFTITGKIPDKSLMSKTKKQVTMSNKEMAFAKMAEVAFDVIENQLATAAREEPMLTKFRKLLEESGIDIRGVGYDILERVYVAMKDAKQRRNSPFNKRKAKNQSN